jgi:hypothetical protein
MAHQRKSGSPLFSAAALFCLSTTAFAQNQTSIYKWIDKDGVVSYSQTKPTDSGAHDVTTIKIEALPAERQRAANRVLANLEKLSDAETAARESRLAAADKRIDAALQRLQQAERNLSAGSTPTGDDRIGNGGSAGNHHARLRDSYFDRVAQLQSQVDQAHQALDAAYAARDQPDQ